MKILIIYECSNGYTCGCCGQTWEETDIVECDEDETPEEFVEWLKESTKNWYKKQNYGRKSILAAHVIDRTLFDETE